MKRKINCPKCSTIVGVEDDSRGGHLRVSEIYRFRKVTGICDHPEPEVTVMSVVFGLVKQTSIYYPETNSTEVSNEYVGPPSKGLLWVAIVFGGQEWIIINGKWALWKPFKGFHGNGMKELAKLTKTA